MEKKKILIIGAGMAGSIAYNALKEHDPFVVDKAKGPTSPSHHAVMRLRDPDVGKYIGTYAEPITVYKAVLFEGELWTECSNTMNNLYSLKLYNQLGERSIRTLGKQKRYLLSAANTAPTITHWGYSLKEIERDNLTNKTYATFFHTKDKTKDFVTEYDICISTIPISGLITRVTKEYSPEVLHSFSSETIHVARATLKVESAIHQTIYLPEAGYLPYRITIEGQDIIAESMKPFDDPSIFSLSKTIEYNFGISAELISDFTVYKQKMGKINQIDDDLRRYLIMDLTRLYSIYSFGRYAIWKPIRTDDYVKDIERIKRMMKISDTRRQYESFTN